jgi:hypothetical protein
MTDMPVFVNDRLVQVPAGSDVAGAVACHDVELGGKLARGEAYATDGRGIELAPGAPLAPGAILRVVVSARRRDDAGA